jgi:exopolysaccharide biosynthesis predicted pyruvyltransferase EpsI
VTGDWSSSDHEPKLPLDTLDQISIAFVGTPSKYKVQTKGDAAFSANGTPATSENYSRAGSALVSLRKKNGANERDDDPGLHPDEGERPAAA